MQPHQQRLISEQEELLAKVTKLRKFIDDSPIFPTLPEDERELLRHQSAHMHGYLAILNQRIARFRQEQKE